MKKIAIVLFVVSAALAGCGKKKAPAAPAEPAAAPAEGAPAEGAPAEGAPAEGAPAEGGGSAM